MRGKFDKNCHDLLPKQNWLESVQEARQSKGKADSEFLRRVTVWKLKETTRETKNQPLVQSSERVLEHSRYVFRNSILRRRFPRLIRRSADEAGNLADEMIPAIEEMMKKKVPIRDLICSSSECLLIQHIKSGYSAERDLLLALRKNELVYEALLYLNWKYAGVRILHKRYDLKYLGEKAKREMIRTAYQIEELRDFLDLLISRIDNGLPLLGSCDVCSV